MSTQQALALPSPAPSNTVVINARCSLRSEADQRVIVVAGLPVHHYRAEDAVAEAYAMVFLVESGFARQTDVARAFAVSVRTIRRYQEGYADGGMPALGREEGWRRGRRRISGKRLRTIEMLKSQGMSNRAIAHRLGVSENAIRKLVGPSKPAESAQLALPAIASAVEKPASGVPSATTSAEEKDLVARSAEEKVGDHDSITAPEAANDDEPVPMSLDDDASDRTLDRQLAYLGLRPHYARVDQEGRTLLHELFATAGDIRVSETELNITLAPLSSPHRTLAAQALCAILDKMAKTFPGSRLRIRFAMRPPRRIGLAFPGSPSERSTATDGVPVP
jgi:transposase-like protein